MTWQVDQEQGPLLTLSFPLVIKLPLLPLPPPPTTQLSVSLEMSILKRLQFTLKYASLSKYLKRNVISSHEGVLKQNP